MRTIRRGQWKETKEEAQGQTLEKLLVGESSDSPKVVDGFELAMFFSAEHEIENGTRIETMNKGLTAANACLRFIRRDFLCALVLQIGRRNKEHCSERSRLEKLVLCGRSIPNSSLR